MTRATLLATLTGSLLDSAAGFLPADFTRHIDLALADFSRFCPLVTEAELQLVAWKNSYPCPVDLESVLACDWGRDFKAAANPWDANWPGRLPDISLIRAAGERSLRLSPAPTPNQISTLGSACSYRYAAAHVLTESVCTLSPQEESAVLLRAQAEAMRELAMKGVTRPVQMRDGVSQGPKNGTPSFLYAALMAEFTERVRR